MKPSQYIQKAIRTESTRENFKLKKFNPRIEHAALGLVTEVGEFVDQIKKAKFYKRDLDLINLIEEVGDLMWYLAVLCDELGVLFEEVWEKNIRKLKVRYPEKYTDEKANVRDLELERKVLEKRRRRR